VEKNKAFFFDRDGILNKAIVKNRKPYSPKFPHQLEKNYEILNLIKHLKKNKFIIIVITNQPELSRGGLFKYSSIFMNFLIEKYFLIDEIFVCGHNKKDRCNCRKPKNGMLISAAKKWNIDFKKSFLIGDRWKDIEAGNSVGCKTIYIDYNFKMNKFNNTKIFADGADFNEMIKLSKTSFVKGLTTNPSLMRKNGISDYESFAKKILKKIKKKPLSFEVFSDNIDEMKEQALKINSWGKNIYVKIPITNTKKKSTAKLIKYLTSKNIKVNVTAVMTLKQVKEVLKNLNPKIPSYISIFAGRIADTGRDPVPTMQAALKLMKKNKNCELIWASTREIYNIYQSSQIKCHIITVTADLIRKFPLLNYNLERYSLDTVKGFRSDAVKSKFKI
jgi:transaldolase